MAQSLDDDDDDFRIVDLPSCFGSRHPFDDDDDDFDDFDDDVMRENDIEVNVDSALAF